MACSVAAALTAATVALEELWRTSLPVAGMCSWWEHPLRKRQQESCFHNCAMAWIWWACTFILLGLHVCHWHVHGSSQLHWTGGIKNQSTQVLEKVLLIPFYPRMIHIIMNCALSIDKYTSAIVEALEPRMNVRRLGNCKCW
jgi:hypothetical protein